MASDDKRIQKWVDPAMFKAEDMPAEAMDKPKVHLIWMTPDPLGAAAALNAMYTGKVTRSLSDVSRADREALLGDMGLTALKTPLEAIKLHFMFEGVTRAFTHQLVRTRTAAYAQESMRFAVVGDGQQMPVQLPPSLEGTLSEAEWYSQNNPDSIEMSAPQRNRLLWDDALLRTQNAYTHMVNNGMPAEDARGLVPTNIKTRINMVTDLRALMGLAGVRLCTQAQFEWRSVFTQIAESIRDYNPYEAAAISMDLYTGDGDPTYEADMLRHIGESDRWQYESIAKVFRPICYMTGKCEFKATADRSCTIRNRVDQNAVIARPSSQWHLPFHVVGEPCSRGTIEPISPAEWLLDPTSAR